MAFLVWHLRWNNYVVVKNERDDNNTEEVIYSDDSESDEYIESDEERDVQYYPEFSYSQHQPHEKYENNTEKCKDTKIPLNGRSSSMYRIRGVLKIDDSFRVILSTDDIGIEKYDSTKIHSNSVIAEPALGFSHFKLSTVLKTFLVYLPLKLAFILVSILLAFILYKLYTQVSLFLRNIPV